jgi:hypothetical protein
LYGAEFSNLVVDGVARSGLPVAVDRSKSASGLAWLKRDDAKVGFSIDRGLKAILYSVANELQVRPSSLVEALIVWMSGQILDEDDRVQMEQNMPQLKSMLSVALNGKPDWADPEEEDPDGVTREDYIEEWLGFWNYVWSEEFYKESATYKLALQPRHNVWLTRLARKKGVPKATLLADIIEALAVRDLGVTPTDHP